ncbi:MAG: SRPBCC family protein [Myxococcota bacterium]
MSERVEVTHILPYAPERVFWRYVDHESWTWWANLGRVTLSRVGSEHRDGEGALRRISNLGSLVVVEEEVVAFEPLSLMRYRLLDHPAAPLTDHEGEVRFRPAGQGTEVTWACRYRPSATAVAPVLRAGLKRLFTRTLGRLERHGLW